MPFVYHRRRRRRRRRRLCGALHVRLRRKRKQKEKAEKERGHVHVRPYRRKRMRKGVKSEKKKKNVCHYCGRESLCEMSRTDVSTVFWWSLNTNKCEAAEKMRWETAALSKERKRAMLSTICLVLICFSFSSADICVFSFPPHRLRSVLFDSFIIIFYTVSIRSWRYRHCRLQNAHIVMDRRRSSEGQRGQRWK